MVCTLISEFGLYLSTAHASPAPEVKIRHGDGGEIRRVVEESDTNRHRARHPHQAGPARVGEAHPGR